MPDQEGAANKPQQLNFSCHCGAIKVSVPRDPAPKHINECMCSNCRKHGAAWVYYPVEKVTITKTGPTKAYLWDEKICEFTWCEACGCTMYWYPTETFPGGIKEMGINTRCIDNLDELTRVERRVTWDMA
ncbi:hypothetical protein LTR91_023360 [Friedmanniomyces endolithicus]|uniref:CENP-V/GFA domain-containing protein n=1 Tax=Friedmanniomyces endolithicus TaxID=329885 RepID=A0AAN6H4M8_9PEZI|nr:hypothetical protein LTR57_022363 [Friedmanniomyces endolithicus]KAK0954322.1 hypothetical protein LTR91_023360 [Friedmanniomyces endolithicus]